MNAVFETGTTVDDLAAAIERCLEQYRDAKGLLLFAADGNAYDSDQLDTLLRAQRLPVAGGLFPQIIYGDHNYERGAIVVAVDHEPVVTVVEGLNDESIDHTTLLGDSAALHADATTMFVFVDGMARRIGALVAALFDSFGLEINYLGGGAGSLSLKPTRCIMTNRGLIANAAVLLSIDAPSGIGVRHGWNYLAGPLKVTEAVGNEIISLDWRPAYQVYREIVEQHSSHTLTKDQFFDGAKSYPFGINRLEAEYVVRDPIMVGPNDSLVCVGEVPVDSLVDVLTGDVESLTAAAGLAATEARSAIGFADPDATVFVDCISRVLFLADRFRRELESVQPEDSTMFGALTLGEIANSGREYLEFYNKTAVVGVIGSS